MRLAFGVVVVVGLVLLGTTVLAWGQGPTQEHREMMDEVLEGSYQALVDMREQTGLPLAPWVQSEEEFAVLEQRHESGMLIRAQLDELKESGSYSDLEALREDSGRPILAWIGSDEELNEWREDGASIGGQRRGMHARMKGMGHRMGGHRGDCPYS